MLKISGSTESKTRPDEGEVMVGGNNRARRDKSELDKSRIDENKIDGSDFRDDEVEKKVQKLFKPKNLSKSKKTVRSDFLNSGAKLAFIKLR